MSSLMTNYYRTIKNIVTRNKIQLFLIVNIFLLGIIVYAAQFKELLRNIKFQYYSNFLILTLAVGTHIALVFLIKKNKKDLYFNQYVRNTFNAFLFRWRREILVIISIHFLIFFIISLIFALSGDVWNILFTFLLLFIFFFLNLNLLIQFNFYRLQKRIFVFLLYYLMLCSIFFFDKYMLIAFLVSSSIYMLYSLVGYSDLNYVNYLENKLVNTNKITYTIKNYFDFILVYFLREKIYLELAIFSFLIILGILLFKELDLFENNIAFFYSLWTLLIVEMSAVLSVGFSELVNVYKKFFIQNPINTYTFSGIYLLIAEIFGVVFTLLTAIFISLNLNFSFLEIPFTFLEISTVILIGMYVSIFFPSYRKKTSILVFIVINIIWLIIKNFVIERFSYNDFLLYTIFLFIQLFLYIAIVIETKKILKVRN